MAQKLDNQVSTEDTNAKKSLSDRAADSFEQVATTTERVGIPVATFSIGAVILALTTIEGQSFAGNSIMAWTGLGLILASLGTYIWLTDRSTQKVAHPPPRTSRELMDVIEWMKNEIATQNQWMRENINAAGGDTSPAYNGVIKGNHIAKTPDDAGKSDNSLQP